MNPAVPILAGLAAILALISLLPQVNSHPFLVVAVILLAACFLIPTVLR